MKFLWPEMLWLLLVVPALVAGYFYLLRRKQQSALKYASLSMVKEAIGAGQRFRRHIPPLLFLLALIAMLVAVARPAAVITLPSQYQTIILAMDVSGSMRAVDVAAQSHYRGSGRGQGLRRRPTLQRTHRRGVLRRNGGGRAGTHA